METLFIKTSNTFFDFINHTVTEIWKNDVFPIKLDLDCNSMILHINQAWAIFRQYCFLQGLQLLQTLYHFYDLYTCDVKKNYVFPTKSDLDCNSIIHHKNQAWSILLQFCCLLCLQLLQKLCHFYDLYTRDN